MIKNGITKKCIVCGAGVYISQSRINTRKYCSMGCARKDNYGFKAKSQKCVVCSTEFTITSALQSQKKTCSAECHVTNSEAISKKRMKETVEISCKICSKKITRLKFKKSKSLCNECIYKDYSKKRIGTGNPNYRNGEYTHKKFQGRKSKVAYKHLNECRRYKKEFIEKHGYQFCEVCGVNGNGTYRFEVHHIYFASKYPRHKSLHDNRNMIHICLECHRKFHAGDTYKNIFTELEKKRKLKELFNII